jgi:hypothetical protein
MKNGHERSSALRGLKEMERQVGSVRGTRWIAGLGAGHSGETSKTKSWTIEPVHDGDRVKRLDGRPGRARGVWWFSHKTIGGRFLGLSLKTKSEGPTRRRRDPGVSGSFEAEDMRRDRMACVGRTRDAARRGRPMARPTNIT